jgi:RNA polymerase I-associated factor PAF67
MLTYSIAEALPFKCCFSVLFAACVKVDLCMIDCVRCTTLTMTTQVRSYLKLYTTISVEKIARFNGMDTATFLATIVSMKYKVSCFHKLA